MIFTFRLNTQQINKGHTALCTLLIYRFINFWYYLHKSAVIYCKTANDFKNQVDNYLRPRRGSYMSQRVAGSLILRPPPDHISVGNSTKANVTELLSINSTVSDYRTHAHLDHIWPANASLTVPGVTVMMTLNLLSMLFFIVQSMKDREIVWLMTLNCCMSENMFLIMNEPSSSITLF